MVTPIGKAAHNSFLHIMSLVIANAEPKAEQKELIMIARQNCLITDEHAMALIDWYGLRAE